MKKYIIILILSFFTVESMAQSYQVFFKDSIGFFPQTRPAATGYFQGRWRTDTLTVTPRDTTWHPVFAGTQTNIAGIIYVWDGAKWVAQGGGGGGSGTVTSVGLTMPTGFSVANSPITTSGTLAVTTTLNGIIKGDGSGFGTVAIGSNITYDGTTISSPTDWHITGNTGTTAGTNFVGTTNSQSLVFKVNNTNAGFIDNSATGNLSFGKNAFGIGVSGSSNTAYGTTSLNALTSGTVNTAIGRNSMLVLTEGSGNVGVGAQTFTQLVTGNQNTAVGQNALTFLGTLSGGGAGDGNIALGYNALTSVIAGDYNIGIGYNSGGSSGAIVGDSNIVIGTNAALPTDTGSNQLSIQNIIYGINNAGTGSTISTGSIGIGIDSPQNKLDIGGDLRIRTITSGTAGTDSVLVQSGGVVKKISATYYGTGGGSSNVFDSLRWINVQWFGVMPSNSEATNTANMEDAVDYVIGLGGGTLYFPYADEPYQVRIIIPGQDFDDNGWIPIRIVGASPPAFSFGTVLQVDYRQQGVILQSSASAVAVIEAQAFSAGFSSVTLYLENLEIRTYPNPDISGIQAQFASQLIVKNVFVNTNIYNVQAIEPTNGTYGVVTPAEGNGAYTTLTNLVITGYRFGLLANEHTSGTDVVIASCYNGLLVYPGPHPMHFNRLGMYRNHYNIVKGGGANAFLKIEQLNIEHADSATQTTDSTEWQITYKDIVDPSNEIYGSISWESILGGAGSHLTSLLVDGAENISLGDKGVISDYRVPINIRTNSSTSAATGRYTNSSGGYGEITKFSTGTSYKNIAGGDFAIYSITGDISSLAEIGGYNWSAGGSSTPQMTLGTTGDLGIGVTSPTYKLDVENTGNLVGRFTSTGAAAIFALNGAAGLGSFVLFQTGGAAKWYAYNNGGTDNFSIANGSATDRLKITQAGIVTMSAYGAGTATFDASGNISSVSDERVKRNIKPYRTGIRELMKINPISYQYNGLSGNEINGTYAGFSAQNVGANIPNSTGVTADGYLTLQDRAILATLVNAVKEQQKEIEELKKEINQLKKNGGLSGTYDGEVGIWDANGNIKSVSDKNQLKRK